MNEKTVHVSSRILDVPPHELPELLCWASVASVSDKACCHVQDLAGFRGFEAVAADPPSSIPLLPGEIPDYDLIAVVPVMDYASAEWTDRIPDNRFC